MMNCRYFDTTRYGNHSSFLTPTMVGGRCPFPLKSALKVTHPLRKTATSTHSAYNVSTVRDSEKSSIIMNTKSTMGFPTSYRWSANVTPKFRKDGSKSEFIWNQSQVRSNEVCYKVSLSENFQGKGVERSCPYLMVHRYWREK